MQSGKPLLEGCVTEDDVAQEDPVVMEQMDIAKPSKGDAYCYFPQTDTAFLDVMDEEYPTATITLNVRPANAWVRSLNAWDGFHERFAICQRLSTSGLPDMELETDEQIMNFFDLHNNNIRRS